MKQPVAFFDIDGTVFRSSLLIELVEALVAAEVFPDTARRECQQEHTAWQSREGSYEDYINAVIRTFLKHIKGVEYGAVVDVGQAMVEQQAKTVYRYTRDLVQELKSEGYFLVAISQSPKMILDPFCQRYGFDKVYGRLYELGPTDKFTGVIEEEFLIQNKVNIVQRVLQQDGFDRDTVVAVGDTDGDISMLEMATQPICFNPNQGLYDAAQARSWPVVVERKDVIYHL